MIKDSLRNHFWQKIVNDRMFKGLCLLKVFPMFDRQLWKSIFAKHE
jgi:hypothetical protein